MSHLEDAAVVVDSAWVTGDRHLPLGSGSGQFRLHISALREEGDGGRHHQWAGQVEQAGERCQRPRHHDVRVAYSASLDAVVDHGDVRPGGTACLTKEARLAAICLDKRHGTIASDRDDEPRKPCAGAQIHNASRRGQEGEELKAVIDVTAPQLRRFIRPHQVDPRVPLQEQRLEDREAIGCFT